MNIVCLSVIADRAYVTCQNDECMKIYDCFQLILALSHYFASTAIFIWNTGALNTEPTLIQFLGIALIHIFCIAYEIMMLLHSARI